jgi:hypothetical protein
VAADDQVRLRAPRLRQGAEVERGSFGRISEKGDLPRDRARIAAHDTRHDQHFLDVLPRRQGLGQVAVVQGDAAMAAVGVGTEEEDSQVSQFLCLSVSLSLSLSRAN